MSELQKARFAVFAYFTMAGAAVTFWAVHIPQVENQLEISHSTLGALLLVIGGGALTAIQLIGHLIDRIGSRTATFLAATGMATMLFFPGLATNLWQLAVVLFVFGFMVGATDTAMNAHAVEVERAYGRPIFSAFHAMWSFGGLIGAALGGVALRLGFQMQLTLSLAAIAMLLLAFAMRGWMLPDRPNQLDSITEAQVSKAELKAERANANQANRAVLGFVLFLGAMAAAGAIAEGTGVDWSALHHARILGTSEAYASIAVVVYTGAMGFTRLVIDKAVARFGRISVIRFGALASALGTSIVVFSTTSPVALIGWVIAGVGISGVVPQIFAYSAEVGEQTHTGRNMAKVVGITYAGVLAGPALIGFLTELVPLNFAIGFGVLLGLFTAYGTIFIERGLRVASAV